MEYLRRWVESFAVAALPLFGAVTLANVNDTVAANLGGGLLIACGTATLEVLRRWAVVGQSSPIVQARQRHDADKTGC